MTTDFKSCNIAVVSSYGLGDGLIMLVLAHNLQQQGHAVTFYNNYVGQLQHWFPHIVVKPYPDKNRLEETFSSYDLVIAEVVSVVTEDVSQAFYQQLAQRYIFISFAQIDSRLVADHTQRILATQSDPLKAKLLIEIAKCNGVLVKRLSRTQAMVQNVAVLCERKMGIHSAVHQNGLVPLPHLIFRKYSRRVIIHPLSSLEIKNWSAKKFLRLAKILKQQQWEPVFVVAPQEQAAWLATVGDEFSTQTFKNMNDLASYIYESSMMIGNDSGIGHLASNLGIATLTIFNITRKRNQYCRWRPGWAHGRVVTPYFTVKLLDKYYWRPFLSVRRVMRVFKLLLQETVVRPL